MPVPRGVKWWIPGAGLLVSATLVTAGFGWTIDRATYRHAVEALESAGIGGVAVANDYRDVTLTGPASVEDVAVTAVADARLVQDVTYVAEGEPAPQPKPSTPAPAASPTPAVSPTPTVSPTPSPTLGADQIRSDLDAAVARASIHFASDSADLSAADRTSLDAVTVALVLERGIDPAVRVVISGYADRTGPAGHNQDLSILRASAVRDYLVNGGAPADMLVTTGYGESNPIADNSTATGRADNRRVELTIRED